MDKLIEKHSINQCYECGGNGIEVNHANITKEVACGFAEWLMLNCDKEFINTEWMYFYRSENSMIAELTPTSELFDLYIKSL